MQSRAATAATDAHSVHAGPSNAKREQWGNETKGNMQLGVYGEKVLNLGDQRPGDILEKFKAVHCQQTSCEHTAIDYDTQVITDGKGVHQMKLGITLEETTFPGAGIPGNRDQMYFVL